MGHNRGSRL
jgi:hypothetical protein